MLNLKDFDCSLGAADELERRDHARKRPALFGGAHRGQVFEVQAVHEV